MTFGEKLKRIREEKGMSQDELGALLGTSKQVISRYETGQRTPKITTAKEYASILGIPLNYLIDDSSSSVSDNGYSSAELNSRDHRDIAKYMDEMREKLLTEDGLMFDGEPLTPEAIDSILAAMQVGMEIAKKKNKEKYTPKKYRKS